MLRIERQIYARMKHIFVICSEKVLNIKYILKILLRVLNLLIYLKYLYYLAKNSLYVPPSSQTIKITLNNIFYDYMDRLKKYFTIFFTQEKLDKMEQNQLITLDKKILTKYIYLLNNIYEKETNCCF